VLFERFEKFDPKYQTEDEGKRNYELILDKKIKLFQKIKTNPSKRKLLKIQYLTHQETLYFEFLSKRILSGNGENRGDQNGVDHDPMNLTSSEEESESIISFPLQQQLSAAAHHQYPSPRDDDQKLDHIPAPNVIMNNADAPGDAERNTFVPDYRDFEDEEKRHSPPMTAHRDESESISSDPRLLEPEPGALGIALSVVAAPDVMAPVVALGMAKVLMMHFPLPQRMDVIEMELKHDLDEFHGDLDSELRKNQNYDFLEHEDGYFYVKPNTLAQRLSLYERQLIVRRKLQFLLENVHRDGISMEDSNRDKFFKHFVGWRQTADDVKVWLSVLEQTTPRYLSETKPLRHILSFREMLICALHSMGENGGDGRALGEDFMKRFGLKLIVMNPVIDRILTEIADPFPRLQRHYRLRPSVKTSAAALLKWWTENYEQAEMDPLEQHYNLVKPQNINRIEDGQPLFSEDHVRFEDRDSDGIQNYGHLPPDPPQPQPQPHRGIGQSMAAWKLAFHKPSGKQMNPERYKTVLCRRWSSGHCSFGPNCWFAHGVHELR